MKVLKFGGTSVNGAQNIKRVAQICKKNKAPYVVVVSAMSGVTNILQEMSSQACKGEEIWHDQLQKMEKDHLEVINELFAPMERARILSRVKCHFNELEELLTGVQVIQELSARVKDRILGYGELLSAFLMAQYIPNGKFVDAREILVTDNRFGDARILPQESQQNIDNQLNDPLQIPVVSGFIGATKKGIPTTLGRGGSDYTASYLAAALEARQLEIWSDVDGMMTADPRITSRAVTLPHLSYAEAMELSHFGAKVIFAPALQPVCQANIPTLLKNTFNPEGEGSRIHNMEISNTGQPVKGVSSQKDIALVNLKGSGLMGEAGISARFFKALAAASVNVILISQSSSEYSISIAIKQEDAHNAKKALDKAFRSEIENGEVNPVEIQGGKSIVAIIGDQMRMTPGISGKLFMALGRNGISVEAIAQGCSERNISFVIQSHHQKKAVEAIHNSFFMNNYVEMNVYVAGVGNVGKQLLEQIKDQQPNLLSQQGIELRVNGIANSSGHLFNPDGLNLEKHNSGSYQQMTPGNLNQYIDKIINENKPNSVFVDCTASSTVANCYEQLLSCGVSVVTANKIACSSEYKQYQKLNHMALSSGVRFLYETNVGAGLPILGTIGDLVRSGDKPQKIEAVLSGTLNFILNQVNQGSSLSEAIEMALEQGYSEPDPRIDLSGMDVQRKLIILARESGRNIEESDVQRIPLLPQAILEKSWPDNFMRKVKEYEDEFAHRIESLKQKGKRLRYVASMNDNEYRVGLQEIDQDHPFFNLEASSNMLLITTQRYMHPMEIKGYGAGAAVTAAGVFADLMKVAHL